jgi:hypothetical protein
MMYNTRNCWISELCPSSGILNNYKSERFGKWICFRLKVRAGRQTSGPMIGIQRDVRVEVFVHPSLSAFEFLNQFS